MPAGDMAGRLDKNKNVLERSLRNSAVEAVIFRSIASLKWPL